MPESRAASCSARREDRSDIPWRGSGPEPRPAPSSTRHPHHRRPSVGRLRTSREAHDGAKSGGSALATRDQGRAHLDCIERERSGQSLAEDILRAGTGGSFGQEPATSAKKCASHPFMNPSAKLRKRRRNLAELGPEILEDTVGGGPKLPGFERECVREGQRTIPEECL